MTGTPLRLFAALPLPEELVDRLVSLQRALTRHWPAGSVRWVRRDQLHLTLRFYGNVPAPDAPALTKALQDACASMSPLRLGLAGLGGFPQARHPRVVWAGVSGDVAALQHLHNQIEAATGAFGEHQENRAFQPHLTLGRVVADRTRGPARPANPASPAWTQLDNDDLGCWTATAVHLIRSELDPRGARYTQLSLAPFTKPQDSVSPSQL